MDGTNYSREIPFVSGNFHNTNGMIITVTTMLVIIYSSPSERTTESRAEIREPNVIPMAYANDRHPAAVARKGVGKHSIQ